MTWSVRSFRTERLAAALAPLLLSPPAVANGRMPGATALTIGAGGTDRVVVRATFGIVSSRDGGRSWRWICEQAVGVSGESDPPLAVTGDGTFVLVSPRGGLLTSADEGCTWSAGPVLFAGQKTVDVASDPANPSRVLALASTVATIDDQGLVTYTNAVGVSDDDARTWRALGALPSDFVGETLEVAPSAPDRIYVSGTANDDPLEGVVLRTTDGGATWRRFTLPLPQGSGSVFIGAVHPTNPDRLWIRVPARGDTSGLFPASLLVSDDGGERFSLVARTDRAMFGFALSPDGSTLAYGGPFDGLFVGPSGGDSFPKVSTLDVRCLKWRSSGLYACASQPGDPFTLGLSPAGDGSFEPLYDARATCPEECPAGGPFAVACEPTWNAVGPAIGASPACPVPWRAADSGAPATDAAAGGRGGAERDASAGAATGGAPPASTGGRPSAGDASVGEPPDAAPSGLAPASGSDCSCRVTATRPLEWSISGLATIALALLRRANRRKLRNRDPGGTGRRRDT